jgi:hypothetical protein
MIFAAVHPAARERTAIIHHDFDAVAGGRVGHE